MALFFWLENKNNYTKSVNYINIWHIKRDSIIDFIYLPFDSFKRLFYLFLIGFFIFILFIEACLTKIDVRSLR